MKSLQDFLAQLPKVELHLHLEGAIPLPALWTLVRKYGGAAEVPDPAALGERFRYRSFPEFIDNWVWKTGFIRELDDFTFLASAVAGDLADQNVRYVEAFFSPGDFSRAGLGVQPIAEALRQGLERHRRRIRVDLIMDLVRDFGPARGLRWLEEVAEVRDRGVIGIGLGGSEHEFPPEPYEQVFARARELGFRTTVHAGEAAGPSSIWGALRILKADRIGHGIRAVEDERLVKHLAERRIPVEVCPMSNVRTGVVAGLKEHPVRRFLDEGMRVSINTDDPHMFQTSLGLEYQLLHETFGWGPSRIAGLAAMAIDSSWADADLKEGLRRELSAYCASASTTIEEDSAMGQ